MPTPVIKLFGRHCFSGKKDGFQEQQTVLIQSFKIGDHIHSRRYPVDGIDPSRLHTILDISIEQYKKHKKLECDLKDAKTKLADRKDIEKAKVLLMQLHGLTEDTAFQLLRKNAMSHRMTIGEMARRLLDAQQLLSNQLNSQLKDE